MTGAVAVVGSVNVDLILTVDQLPAPGETALARQFRQAGGGKGANQAVAAARLGVPTHLVACLGDDAFGVAAREELVASGVGTSCLRTSAGPTGVAVVLVDASGENSIAVAPGANASLDVAMVDDALATLSTTLATQPADRVVLLASLEVPLRAVQRAARIAREQGWTVVLNPAPTQPLPREVVADVDVLTPNQHEIGRLGFDTLQDLLEAGASAVVVTRGADGADLYLASGEREHVTALPVDVTDTTGAGDCLSGALAAALAAGGSLRVAVEVAVAAGSLAARNSGARGSLPSRDELRSAIPAAVATVPDWR